MGKATHWARMALAKSPRKRSVIVKKLFDTYVGENVSPQNFNKRKSLSALTSETIDIIKAFYERDDVSRQALGLKDVTTVKENGAKKKFKLCIHS